MTAKDSKMSSRSYYYDNIKGFLIVLVVFAHFLYELQHFPLFNTITDSIYMFHMPAFVFVSGYFGKSKKAGSFNSVIKLIFLYFVFNSVALFITNADSLLYPVNSYWYIIALCIWRLTADKIAKFKEIMLILLAVSIFAGFYSSIDNTFAISRIIAFYPFYMAGYLLSKEKSEELENKPYKKRFLMGVVVSFGIIVLGIIAYRIFGFSDSDLLMYPYSKVMGAFGRIFLYLIAFGSIYALRLFGLNKKIPFITAFGRNSIGIFLFHRPFTIIFSNIFRTNPAVILILSVIATFLLCLLFGNDYVTLAINKICDGFAELFSEDKKDKKSVPKTIATIVILLVGLCCVLQIVRRYY